MQKTFIHSFRDLGAIKFKIAGLSSRLLDIVYPTICASCGVHLHARNALCADCWQDAQFIAKPYCEITGRPFAYDLGEGIISADALANPPPFHRARAALIYDGVSRQMVHRLKYKDRTDLADMMANWMIRAGQDCLDDADCIIPVPLHRWRLMARKYNQSAELGRIIGQKTSIRYLPATLVRTKSTKPQIGLPAKVRQDNVRGAFKVSLEKKGDILGQNVVLIDDVFTTGATVNSATKALLRAGAEKVSVLTFARVQQEY